MQITIENFINNIKDSKKRKRFLKICFDTDIKAKQRSRFPKSFLILQHHFSQREVMFASKIYLDEYATEEELEKYYQVNDLYVNSLVEYSKKIYLIYKKSFYTYLKYGLFSEQFYKLTNEFLCDIEDLLEYPKRYDALYANHLEREEYKNKKEVFSKEVIKHKFYYEICQKYKWDYKKIELLSIEFGKPIPYILNMANLYIVDDLKKESLREISNLLNRYYSKQHPENITKIVLEKLESLDNLDEIINYLLNIKIKPSTLKICLDDYLKMYKKDLISIELKNLKQTLLTKIDYYQNYLDKIKDDKEKNNKILNDEIFYNESLITQFLNGNYISRESFCTSKGIQLEKFDEIIYFISKNNKELYQQYYQYMRNLENKNKTDLINTIKKIVNYIKYGINDNGILRHFDILDYFTMTNLPFNDILSICKSNLKREDYNYLFFYINKNRTLTLITEKNLEMILSEKNVIGIEFDANNQPIPGTGYEVTREEKLEIIEQLKEQNLPLYYQVYILSLNRKFNIVHKKINK